MSIKLLAMQSFDEIWEIFKTQFPLAIWETLYTTVLATALATIIGLPLGVLLVAGENGRILRVPAFVLRCISAIINLLRSVPFLILMVVVIPFTRLIVGTYVGTLASVVPLVIAAFPFIARLAESSLREVNPNVIEAAQSMGASPMQIIIKVMIPESIPSLISNATIAVTTILGYTAMSGALGGGGVFFFEIRRKVTAHNHRSVEQQICCLHCIGKVGQVRIPDFRKKRIVSCPQRREKLFDRHLCRRFQRIRGTIRLKAPFLSAVALRPFRVDADMLERSAVHRKPHRQILHNLLLRRLAVLIDVLIHTFLINLF